VKSPENPLQYQVIRQNRLSSNSSNKKMENDDIEDFDDELNDPMPSKETLDQIGMMIVPILTKAREQGVPEEHIENAFKLMRMKQIEDPIEATKILQQQLKHLKDEYTIPKE
jgi:predicted type IV restriction endonuclease